MQKLGLDLGSSSIGWALREGNEIIKKGVITFDSGMTKGQGGYSSPTKDRREARSKRKLVQARKYRKWALLELLCGEYAPIEQEQLEAWSKYKKGEVRKFPENQLFLKWLGCDFSYLGLETKYQNPYQLRVNALDNPLHKHEFGRALYHLVQRRGYKNIGENENEEFDVELAKKDSETKNQLERRAKDGFAQALENNRTIAEALLNDFIGQDERARNQYPLRREYNAEFEQICKGQGYDISKNDKGEYNYEFIQKLWKAIIWQRPLRSQKGNIGKCTLETDKPRCPISHPVFEIYRAWGYINTIKYFDEDGIKQSITKDLRNKLFNDVFLKEDKNFKFEKIRKYLDKQLGTNKKYNYPFNKKEQIYDSTVSGMPVCKGLISVFGNDVTNALLEIENYNIGNAPSVIDKYSIYDLWHGLFSFDEKYLQKFSLEKINVANSKTKKGKEYNPFAELKGTIAQGYADLSLKAMCKIIPFLKEGYLYNEAAVLAKIPELMGKDWIKQRQTIEDALKQSSKEYEHNKTIAAITNKLIEDYKGDEYFARNDFQYILAASDITDVEIACIGNFGEKTWAIKKDREQILAEVTEQYQAFFKDTKRAFRSVATVTKLFNDRIQQNNIELKGELYHHSNRENIYLKRIKDKENLTKLPEARIDSIKNPMFNKALSILRKLVNTLIDDGTIDEDTEIVIELARELNDNNKRAAIESYQKERERNRDKYREFLKEFQNIERPLETDIAKFEMWTEQTFRETENELKEKITNKDHREILKEKESIKRYELWMEQKGQCMYTGKMISITQLFSNEIDILHTIPRSLLPDNTMANMTVGYSRYNRDLQKQRFPTECDNYYKDVEGWGTCIESRLVTWIEKRDYYEKQYEDNAKPKGTEDEKKKNERIQAKHYFKLHYEYWHDKVQRFTADEVKDSWARRQLVDTQMISKYAREFLKTYFNKVAVQKGITTAQFRKLYSFQEEDEIKSRNKHTHHAIDAAVLTFIPVNASHRDKLLKKMYEIYETEKRQYTTLPFAGFNSQTLINDIENNTLIVNYENDKILKQTYRNVRVRGKLQYKTVNGKKILLKSGGDTVRSELYAQTYLGKIKDVERYDDGQPKREGKDWKYKTGKDEFVFVKRKSIKDALANIEDIVDPIIKELVKEQKNNAIIKDYQGNTIRHVRLYTKAGKEVKDRINYKSKHEYKNKFYSESGSLPYAVLLQKIVGNKIERAMIPVASFELAKAYKKHGSFVIDEFIKKYDEENKTDYSKYPDKKLLKVGQKVLVLKNDNEYDKKNDIKFQKNRLYRITQFANDGGKIMLQYHLEAQGQKQIDNIVKSIKDALLIEIERQLDIPMIVENISITDYQDRKKDLQKRKDNFKTRLNIIESKSDSTIAQKMKTEIEKFVTESSEIGNSLEAPPLLKMSQKNWNFLYEGEDFEVSLLGKIPSIAEKK